MTATLIMTEFELPVLSFEQWLLTDGAPRPTVRPGSFYTGGPGRELVFCAECGEPADLVVGGHHGGGCGSRLDAGGGIRTDLEAGHVRLAELIIRYTAAVRPVFSANNTRALMDAKHIPVQVRSAAFRRLAGDVMAATGYEASTERPRRGHEPDDVCTYRSLTYQGGES